MTSTKNISSFCFYHYIDNTTSTYKCYLSQTNTISCSNIGNGWYLGGKFYSINPSITPKPYGLQNIAIIQDKGTRNISDIAIVNSIFNNKYNDDNLNTITTIITAWTAPMPNTTPLYVHVVQNNIFLSWNKNPPPADSTNTSISTAQSPDKNIVNLNSQNLIEKIVPQIFVLSSDIFGDDYQNIKFQCLDGIVTPYTKDIPNLFYYNEPGEPLPIYESIINCNQKNNTEQIELAKIIKNLSEIDYNNKLNELNNIPIKNTKIPYKINPIIISIIVSVFLLCIIVLVTYTLIHH